MVKPILHPGCHARSCGKLVDNRYACTMSNERCRNIEGLCRDDFANRDVLPIELGLEQFAERPRASQPDNVMPFQSLKGEALFRYVQFLTAIKQRPLARTSVV